jgi:hypothetical protein
MPRWKHAAGLGDDFSTDGQEIRFISHARPKRGNAAGLIVEKLFRRVWLLLIVPKPLKIIAHKQSDVLLILQ